MKRAPRAASYSFESTDLPLIQELIRLGIEVHGTLDLFRPIQAGRMRRLLAGEVGDVPSRSIASNSLLQLLRYTWTASLLVKNPDLVERCINAVDAFSTRAPNEVQQGKSIGRLDAYCEQANWAKGCEREALLDCWREAQRKWAADEN